MINIPSLSILSALAMVCCVGTDPTTGSPETKNEVVTPTDREKPTPDASVAQDASAPRSPERACDPQGAFLSVVNVAGINGSAREASIALSKDERIAIFASDRNAPGSGNFDLFLATRVDANSTFDSITELANLNSSADEAGPSISADGSTLYFHSSRSGAYQIYVSKLETPTDPASFAAPIAVTGLPIPAWEPAISANGLALYYEREIAMGDHAVARADLGVNGFTETSTYAGPSVVARTTTGSPALAAGEKGVFVYGTRSSPEWSGMVFLEFAAQAGDYVNVSGTSPPGQDLGVDARPSWTSPDDCRLYFASARPFGKGETDLWVATRAK
jgi:hypothetical protein